MQTFERIFQIMYFSERDKRDFEISVEIITDILDESFFQKCTVNMCVPWTEEG